MEMERPFRRLDLNPCDEITKLISPPTSTSQSASFLKGPKSDAFYVSAASNGHFRNLSNPQSLLAHPRGFEPPTSAFGVKGAILFTVIFQ